MTSSVRSNGETIRRWTMRAAAYPGGPRPNSGRPPKPPRLVGRRPHPRGPPTPPRLVGRRPHPRGPPTPRGSSGAHTLAARRAPPCKIRCTSGGPDSAVWSQIRDGCDAFRRTLRVPSDPPPSLPNTCSPRRSPAARGSARCASWCARPLTRPPRSRRWVRHRLRSGSRPGPLPPPRASTRTAGHSVVTRGGVDQDRSCPARRSASRRYPISRHRAPDHPAHRRPVWEDGLAGRAYSSNALGPPHLAARAPWTC
jgi:hypothetical protein